MPVKVKPSRAGTEEAFIPDFLPHMKERNRHADLLGELPRGNPGRPSKRSERGEIQVDIDIEPEVSY